MIRILTTFALMLSFSILTAQNNNGFYEIENFNDSKIKNGKISKSFKQTISKRDSSKTYNFTTSLDSTPKSKTLYSHTDSTVTRINYIYNDTIGQWELDYKYIQTINDNNDFTESVTFNWNNGWEPIQRISVNYNQQDLAVLFLIEGWNSNQNQWYEYRKFEYQYNNGQMTQIIEYTDSSGTSNYGPSSKTTYSYNSNDSLSTKTEYAYNEGTLNWDESEKTSYYYYSSNNMLESKIESYYVSNIGWMFSHKFEYTYNNNNKKILQEEFDYNSSMFTWEKDYKIDYSYDSLNNNTLKITSNWDSGAGAYEPYRKYKWEYIDTLLTTYTFFKYNSTAGSFTPDFRETKEYNSSHLETKSMEHNWNENTATWVKSSKEETKYNSHGDKIVISDYSSDASGAYWEIDERKYQYFTLTSTGSDIKNSKNIVNIYPNPASDYVEFNFNNDKIDTRGLKIFNNSGKIIYSKEMSAESPTTTLTWNSSSLPAGAYFAVIETDKQIYTRKLIIK